VVKQAAKGHMNYHLTKKDKEWDIAWFDAPVSEEFIKKMKPW
jgi:tubulin polyglutamylase TTLL6/13